MPESENDSTAHADTLSLLFTDMPNPERGADNGLKFHSRGFFSDSPWLHPEVSIETSGFAAELRPYELRNDEWITGTLLGCFLFLVFYIRYIWRFLSVQAKKFFIGISTTNLPMHETKASMETHYGLVMTLILGLMYSLTFYGYTQQGLQLFLGKLSPYTLIGHYFACVLLYFASKGTLTAFVNCIFFDKTKRTEWKNANSFLIFIETITIFPILLTLIYFNISSQNILYIIFFLFILVKSFLLFKTFRILFNNLHCLLHFFVYFCALEIIPMIVVWKTLIQITNRLIVIF